MLASKSGDRCSIFCESARLQVMHKRLAAKSLVGKGRSEPNQNPVLDEPAGRLQFNPLRPDVMLKKLLGPVTRFPRSTACEQMFGTGIVADEDRVTRDVTPPLTRCSRTARTRPMLCDSLRNIGCFVMLACCCWFMFPLVLSNVVANWLS